MKDKIDKTRVLKLKYFDDQTTKISINNNLTKHKTSTKQISNSKLDSQEINITERELTKILKQQLQEKFKWIDIFKNPSASKIAKNYLIDKIKYIPLLQPEIDMIFLEKSYNLNAIEVKLFRPNDLNYKMRFYKGIDQALARHRYGFDHVALWQFFHPNICIDEINRYGAGVWYFIRNSLKLPLDFSYFRISYENNEFKFQILQYEETNKGFLLGKNIDDPDFRIEWRYENPYKSDKISIYIRESFVKYMKIPVIKIYNSESIGLKVIANSYVTTSPISKK